MSKTQPYTSRRRKWLRGILLSLSILTVLLGLTVFALTLPAVQQQLTKKAESWLNQKLGTRVEVGAIRLRFPYYVSLEGFLLEDERGDTLARIGNLVVDIGMWKLLDNTIQLKKIMLEDAAIHLNQRDSTYNFDFIVKAFSKPDQPSPVPADTTASAWKLQLDPATVDLERVDFILQDEDSHETTQAKIGSAQMDIVGANLADLQFDLDHLNLADADIRLQQTQKTPPSGKPSPVYRFRVYNGAIARTHILYATTELYLESNLETATLQGFSFQSAPDFQSIQTGRVQIENSALIYRDPTAKATPGHLNAGDLDLSGLDADLSSFSFQNDTLFVQSSDLKGVDKSGVEITAFKAGIHVTPGSIDVQDAEATLNRTSLSGSALLFKNDKAEFDRMDIRIRQAKGVFGDVLRAIPPLDNEADLAGLKNTAFEVAGKLNGTLQNLQTQNIRFRAATGTFADFTGSVQHLDEPKKLGIQLNVSRLETNRNDLIQWMSVGGTAADSATAMLLPAYLRASGALDGSLSSLKISLVGEAGPLQTGIVPPPAFSPPAHFDLAGTLTQVDDPDRLGMDLKINRLEAPRPFFALLEPQGVTLPDVLSATGTLKGTLAALQTDLQFQATRGSANSELALKGVFKNLQSTDSLGFDIAFNGALARREILGYIPDSTVNQMINLPAMVQIEGDAKGNVKDLAAKATLSLGDLGKILMDGTLRDSTYNVNLLAQNLRVGQLAADTSLRPMKTVGLHASIKGEGFQFGQSARFQVDGKFDSLIWENIILRDIVLAADVNGRKFTGKLQSPDERAAVNIQASGDFTSKIPLLETDISLNCVDLRLLGWSNRPTTVCMRIKSRSEGMSADTLSAQVSIENIDLQYDTVHVRPGDLSFNLNLHNNSNKLTIASDWLSGEIKGYFSIADLPATLNNIAEQYFIVDRMNYVAPKGTDSLSVHLHLLRPELLTTGLIPGLSALEKVNLEGLLDARRNYFEFNTEVSNFVYQGWSVDSLKMRAYAADTAALFFVSTPLVRKQDKTFVQNAVLDGQLIDNSAKMSFTARDSEGKDRFLIAANAELSKGAKETVIRFEPQQLIDFHAWTVDPKNEIRIAGSSVSVKDFKMEGNGQSVKIEGSTGPMSNKRTGLDFTVDISRLDYNNFDLFVSEYVTQLDGWAQVKLKIGGSTDAMQVRGSLQLHETTFTPTLTNVKYQLSETPLEFTSEGIILDGLTLRDPYNKTLVIRGKIATSDWQNMRSDLTFEAEKFEVLNTVKQLDKEYYGQVFVSFNGSVRGPTDNLEILLNAKTAKESNFTYVYDVATQNLQHEGIVVFVQPLRQNVRPPVYDAPVTNFPFTLSASIEIDSNLTVNSVINPVTGDNFNGTAMGRLQFDFYPNGNMSLAGRLELVKGIYNYSYQSVVTRSFQVAAGSSIIWSGDVTEPELAIKARYVFLASPYPLVSNQLTSATPEEAALYRSRQTFYLQTSLNGTPNNPDIGFAFIYPPDQKQDGISASFGNTENGLVTAALSTVNQDPNALSKQVFGVLLLRNFLNDNDLGSSFTGSGDPLRSGLSNFLTGQVNALADQYLSFIDIDLEAKDAATLNSSGQAQTTTDYQLRVQKSFFDDRLTFKLSGGTSVDANGNELQSGLENASIEYSLTPDGGLKVKVFSEKGFELLNASASNLRNSGAGFVATKEFDSRRKRKQ